ncbi:epidermal growth factor receptor kinase substrate 8 [Anoplophora glabripennis]|uniref:Epidermal growth factor receptor kinase substrate 8-like protein 2 n=1 Tax=Anoplophora glabripennis TaxID=217634 RepID=V5GT81_ANOGL|nr:epidermal growth factor receptor kinase substrate 8 [Anoplophora glabripennis]
MAYRNGYSGDDRDVDRDRDDRMNDGVGKPIHIIEHLATFTVTKETGIIYPADGMRRLLQLEKTNGIWSQKMQLCLDNSWVLIMDYETGSVMERFPANSIQEPTAFMSQDPMEMYNNILVFIVTNSNQSHPPEMHIFQCQSISAQDLVEDLMQLRMGKALTRSRKSSIPPPSHKPPQNVINPSRDVTRDYHGSDSELTANNDDSSSTTSEKYERDVTILNHCFDDIEKFIARLQHAAAAARELERRRKNRKTKKRDMGDGMLTMRTKPPPEKEFIDIFQKFKLSFNLLAKLKAHIHDPNAPELVHFLFTPLALIVEASHDTYFDQHLPHNVIAPLLTREAVNLLMNCVTSKETELWHSLGSAWLMPRDQYKGHVPSYHPVFMDGWSPEYPVIDELDSNIENKSYQHDSQYSGDYNDYQSSSQDNILMYDRSSNSHRHQPEKDLSPTMGDSTRSDISVDSIERNGGDERGFGRNQESFLEDLQNRGANIVQVTYPRTANNDKELTVVRGEFLEILDDSRKWWKARNSRGQVAHVPHTIVTPYVFNNPLYTQNYNRRAESPVFNTAHNSQDHPAQSKNNTDWIRNERLEQSSAPPPPPPPLPPAAPPAPPLPEAPKTPTVFKRAPSRQSIKSAISVEDRMQEELSSVLTLVRERTKERHLDIKQTPETYIDNKSTAKDVQEWLNKKGFSQKIQDKFIGIAGHHLFDIQKPELERICGRDEGKRLFSQLSIQKSISGYQTVRTTELKAILAKARQKIETS